MSVSMTICLARKNKIPSFYITSFRSVCYKMRILKLGMFKVFNVIMQQSYTFLKCLNTCPIPKNHVHHLRTLYTHITQWSYILLRYLNIIYTCYVMILHISSTINIIFTKTFNILLVRQFTFNVQYNYLLFCIEMIQSLNLLPFPTHIPSIFFY